MENLTFEEVEKFLNKVLHKLRCAIEDRTGRKISIYEDCLIIDDPNATDKYKRKILKLLETCNNNQKLPIYIRICISKDMKIVASLSTPNISLLIFHAKNKTEISEVLENDTIYRTNDLFLDPNTLTEESAKDLILKALQRIDF